MSITTLALQESMLLYERPVAWWGLDTADPTADDAVFGTNKTPYTLTALGTPANAATLHTRGDAGASGCRDFNGSTGGYFVNGTIKEDATQRPTFVGLYSFRATGGNVPMNMITPYGPYEETIPGWASNVDGVRVGDLMIAFFNSTTAAATMSTTPAGWTQLGATTDYTQGTFAVFWRVATSADEEHPTYTWQWSGATDLTGFIIAYRNVDPATLIFDSGLTATASSTDHATSSETVPAAAVQLVCWNGDFFGFMEHGDPTGGEMIDLATVDSTVTELSWGGSNLKTHIVEYEYADNDPLYRVASTTVATTMGAAMITFGAPQVTVRNELDTIASNITLGCLINADTLSGTDTIIRKHQAWGVQCSGTTLQFLYRDGGGVDRTISGPTLGTGSVRRIWVRDDGTNIKFTVNGSTTSVARTGSAGYTTNTNRVSVGHYNDTSTNSNFFDGRIDELAVFNTCLSDDQIAAFEEAAVSGTFGTQVLPGSGMPKLKLEIAFDSDPTRDCFAFENVTSYMREQSWSSTVGRNFETDRMEAGRADFTLNNRTRAFDDQNASSPFYPNVKPTRPVRLRAQTATDAVIEPIFFGYTEGHPLRREQAGLDEVAVFTAADIFKGLALDTITETDEREQELSGARISAILDGVTGVPYTGDAGQSEVVAAELNTQNRLEHAQSVAETDGGVLFGSRTGVATFQDRHNRPKNERTVRATFGNGGGEIPYLSIEPQVDESRLFTAAAITPPSTNVQAVENTAASDAHFKRTKELSTLHASDIDALGMATAYANRYSTPRTRIPEVRVTSRSPTNWATMLSLQISHRVKTVDRPFGATVNREHYVEGIRHDISPSDWRLAYSVSPAELDGEYLLIGTGKIGDNGGATSGIIGW